MMLCTPLIPRRKDKILRVIIQGRITQSAQDMVSIVSQHEDVERWLDQNYSGSKEIRRLGEQASGWLANRDSMMIAQQIVEQRGCDAVIVTEVREIYRNPEFLWGFVHRCVDHGVRFIAINDHIDTCDKNWEIMMYAASMRHGMTVPEARSRVRRKATTSFSQGGMVMKVKFGYRKLTKEEAASGQFGPVNLRITKRKECTDTIKEMRCRVMRGESYESVARWLNESGVGHGPYVERGCWIGKVVRDLLTDPILSGRRRFRAQLHQMVYASGKHRTRPNPDGPEVMEYPELAHLTVPEHEELLACVQRRKEGYAACQAKGEDSPLFNRPRTRSIWPGQHARCGICQGMMYRSGKFLKCQNALAGGPRTCWNHLHADYEVTRRVVLAWVLEILAQQPAVRNAIVQSAWHEFQQCQKRHRSSGQSLAQIIEELEKQAKALAKAIGKGGQLEALVAELAIVSQELQKARSERERLHEQGDSDCAFKSETDVAAQLDGALDRLAQTSFEFAELLRRLIPRFVIHPVQALDSPLVRPRAELVLSLAAWTKVGEPVFEMTTELDLFDSPVHIRHLRSCVELKQVEPSLSLNQTAQKLGVHKMTVKRALAYAQLMEKEGLSEPYRRLSEKPATASRWGKREKSE